MKIPAYIQAVIVIIGVFLFVAGMQLASGVLIPLATAFLLALLLYPIVRKLESWRFPRWIAIILGMIGILAILGAVFFLIFNEMLGFYDEIPKMTQRMEIAFSELQQFIEVRFNLSPENQISWLNENLSKLLENSGELFAGLLSSTSGFITTVGIIPFYIFFILYYREMFRSFIFSITNEQQHNQVALIIRNIQKVIQNYLVGLSIVIFIVAVLNTVGLLIIGVPHAIFFGVFAALLTIIPYIGVIIGSALPILYTLAMADSLWTPFLVFIVFNAIQTLEGNLITPNITGSKVSINPLAAILALFIGGEIWGIAGMIMFVPFIAMLKVVFDHIETLQPYGILLGIPAKSPNRDTKTRRWFRRKRSRTTEDDQESLPK